MHIKSITLEGFKSYGTKVVINHFDTQFNAITGLNGSGKSNILDSICFVLGIQNLTQVRATSLNELVYKNGQAGINKATVSILFDNSKKGGPLGYEDVKEILITRTLIANGKSKYFINGNVATNNRVHDLFQSVQLNISNPHFLIMQGRITKVLNMKPMEILGMIEEAAGTSMYEEKRVVALRNLERKDTKLREINTMLDDHICPQLEKLKADKMEFANYQRMMREHEQLSKLYTAWDYSRTEELVLQSDAEKEKLIKNFADHKTLIKDLKQELLDADKRISEIEKQMDTECGSKLQEIEAQLKSKQVIETKADTQARNLKDALNEEKKKHADLVKNLKDEKDSAVRKEKELTNYIKKLETLKSKSDEDSKAIAAAENHFHAVNAGLADTAGEEASLAAQLIAAGKDKKDAETEAKSLDMSMKHIKAELVKKEAENKRVDKSYTQDQALYQKLFNEAQKIKAEMAKLNYQEGTFENLKDQERKISTEVNTFQKDLNSIMDNFPRLLFDYTDPVKNFDRSKVIGPLCLQMELKDPKEALAIDVAAGAKLYNILVDTDTTSRLLLDKGRIKVRSTILPLNKMQGTVINNKTVQDAEHLVGKGNAAIALSRIVYDKKVSSAMEFAFGNVFICPSMQHAKQVTLANHIRKRSVTYEGEVFDPAGTLSGGSMNNRNRLLTSLAPVPKLKKQMQEKQNQLAKLNAELYNLERVKQRYDMLSQQYELKENEAELLKLKIEQSTHHKQMEEFKNMQQSLEDQKARLAACKEKQKNAEKLIKELEVKTSKNTREDKVKEAEKKVADCKKKAAVSLEKYNTFQSEVDTLRMEIEGINEGLPACEEQIEASVKLIQECEARLVEAAEKQKAIKEEVGVLTDELKKQKSVLKSHSSDINKIGKEKDAMTKKIADAELQMQQWEHDIKNCGDNTKEASRKLKHLLEKNKWIEGQKKYFGVKNSEFDFSKLNPRETASMLKQLEENIEKSKKNVNTRAQNNLSTVEEQYDGLLIKKKAVLRDKEVIEQVIRELDEQKKTALKQACAKVNDDFGSIFRILLPGTNAMIIPQKDKTVLEGLEFKIAFGNVWKESLNELSGGQRSLVALSLILALLKYKPAPIYILDEVDAALDLSHTQNIGKMLKMHFQQSQFIIVSLKDGMFSNANVLFSTKFSDGMSSVIRTSQKDN